MHVLEETQLLTTLLTLAKEKQLTKIKEELETLPSTLKGKIFELFMTELFKGNGWIAVRKGGKHDKGADILLFHPKTPHDVSLIVQVKNQKQPLSFDDTKIELIKFETQGKEVYECNQYLLLSINGFVQEAKKLEEFNMRLDEWTYVEKLIYGYDPLANTQPEIELYSHNKIAFDKILTSWLVSNRTAAVQPTGSGKSFLILKTLTEFAGQNVVVLAPTHIALNQIQRKSAWSLDHTTLLTYAKLSELSEKELKRMQPSLIVLDEFHRCGSDVWGKKVNELLTMYPKAKVLGTTATPVRFLDQQRDMKSELFQNNVASEMSLTEAIVKGILPIPKYISALYTLEEELTKVQDKIEQALIPNEEKEVFETQLNNIKLDWEHSQGIPVILKSYIPCDAQKFIVFCKDKEHLEKMEWVVESWFQKAKLGKRMKKFRVVSGEEGVQDELNAFEQHDANSIHLLFCIDMLNESYHLNDIDGVLLLRPTQSPIIFYQQIGRCISVGGKNPLIFDLVNNFSNIRAKDFLNDLKEVEQKENHRRKDVELAPNYLHFDVIDRTKEPLKLFKKLEHSLRQTWDIYYENLKKQIAVHGTFLLPKTKEHSKVNQWMNKQRSDYKRGVLDLHKIHLLNDINFPWEVKDYQWQDKYEKLRAFYDLKGHCDVSTKEEENELYLWSIEQRKLKQQGRLSPEQLQLLDNLSFTWTQNEHTWMVKYQKLAEFKERYHHCSPSSKHHSELALWTNLQRNSYRKGKLEKSKQHLLDALDFPWTIEDASWERKFHELMLFKETNEHLAFLTDNVTGYQSLYKWCNEQREAYITNTLAPQWKTRLDDIGFPLEKTENDALYYELLTAFYRINGHCYVDKTSKNKALIHYVKQTRKAYEEGTLPEQTIQRLNTIQFVWNIKDFEWEQQFNTLLRLKHEYGHLSFRNETTEEKQITKWIKSQRDKYKKNQLTDDQVKKLKTIVFTWLH